MKTFALIVEGSTDHAFIESLINFVCSKDESECTCFQPLRDETDNTYFGEKGGWERVLEYCSLPERIHEALALNDYFIIQIDSDRGDDINFDIGLTIDGKDKSVAKIIEDTIKLLIEKIGRKNYEYYQSRILFAICVHSLECWFLPHYGTESKKRKIKTCESHLSHSLSKVGVKFSKDFHAYRRLANAYRKKANIIKTASLNESFNHFYLQLTNLSSTGNSE